MSTTHPVAASATRHASSARRAGVLRAGRHLPCVPLALLLLAVTAAPSRAVDWNVAGPADWNTAGNWNPAVVPSGTSAIFSNGGEATITGAVPNVTSLFIGNNTPSPGDGTVTQSGGSLTVTDWLIVGRTPTETGTYNISDGTLTKTNSGASKASISEDGTGFFNQTGGTVNIDDDLVVGNRNNSSGTYTMSAGQLNVTTGTLVISESGNSTGLMTLSGAADVNVTNDVVIGQAGLIGTVDQSGTSTIDAANVFIGLQNGGDGVHDFSGGTVATGRYNAGLVGGSTGETNLSGSAAITANWVTFGNTGTGTLNMTGGTINAGEFHAGRNSGGDGTVNQSAGTVNANWIGIGEGGTATGDYNLSGSGLVNVTSNSGGFSIKVGHQGTGTFDQTGGTATLADGLGLGAGGGTGTYTISSGPLTVGDELVAGQGGGTGTFTQDGGDVDVTNAVVIGDGGGSTGNFNISDGTFDQTNGHFYVGTNGATATATQTGGTVTTNLANAGSSNWTFIGEGAGSTGTYNISGGTLDADNSTILAVGQSGGDGTVNQSEAAGTSTVNARELWIGWNGGSVGEYNLSDGTLTVDDRLGLGRGGATGTLNVSGGSVIATGAGGVVDETGTGTIAMSGDGSLAVPNGPLTVDNLSITGSLVTTTVGGDLTMSGEGTLSYLLDPAGVSAIDVTGAVNANGALSFDFTGSGLTDAFTLGDIVLIDNALADAIAGQYTGRPELSTVIHFGTSAYWLTYNYDSVTGTLTGNDLALIAVPEPSTLLLAALGLLGAAGWLTRRRRRR